MGEVFWISGLDGAAAGQHSNLPAALHTLLWRANVRPTWVDQIHWQAEQHEPEGVRDELAVAGFADDIPIFHWPYLPHLEHAIIQARCRSLLLGDTSVVAIGQHKGDALTALVLASEAAMERYNLRSRFSLAAMLTVAPRHRSGTLIALADALEKTGIAPAQVEWLALANTPDREEIIGETAVFENASWLAMRDDEAGAIPRLNGLVQALDESAAAVGLLVSAAPGHPVLATLIRKA